MRHASVGYNVFTKAVLATTTPPVFYFDNNKELLVLGIDQICISSVDCVCVCLCVSIDFVCVSMCEHASVIASTNYLFILFST